MRIVLWDDNQDIIDQLKKGILKATKRKSADIEVYGYRDDWFENAINEAKRSGNQLWLVDIRTDIHQKNQEDLSGWMKTEINADQNLKIAYEECDTEGYCHNGFAIAIFARKHCIPIKFVSHYASQNATILSILAGTKNKLAVFASDFGFEKYPLMMDLDLDESKKEYDRIVEVAQNIFKKEATEKHENYDMILACKYLLEKIESLNRDRRSGLETSPDSDVLKKKLSIGERDAKTIYQIINLIKKKEFVENTLDTLNSIGKKYQDDTWKVISI